MKLFVLKNATRVVVARKAHDIPINLGLLEWFRFAGKVKPASEIEAFDSSKKLDCQYDGSYAATSNDIQGEGEGFNPVDDTALSAAPMGSHVQHAQVSNEQPGYLQSLNKWKFRMDWPHGNHSRVGMLCDDQNNHLDTSYDAMRDRLYDSQRQDMYFRIGRGEQVTMCKEVMPYEDWAPIAADHRFLNNVGRQFQAEEDEKWMLDTITTGHSSTPGAHFFGLGVTHNYLRNADVYKKVKAKVNQSVLRSQFF